MPLRPIHTSWADRAKWRGMPPMGGLAGAALPLPPMLHGESSFLYLNFSKSHPYKFTSWTITLDKLNKSCLGLKKKKRLVLYEN